MSVPQKTITSSNDNLETIQGNSLALRNLVHFGELLAAWGLLFSTILIVPYANIQWSSGGSMGAVILLIGGFFLACQLIRANWSLFRSHFATYAANLELSHVLFIGVLCHIAVATITQPDVASDPYTYITLADRLARGVEYIDESGHQAFWPPGLPIFLSAFVFFFGAGVIAVSVANLVLYVIGAYAAWDLGRRIFDRRVANIAALLFTIWPSRLLSAAVASKENLTVAMMLAGSTLCVAAFRSSGRDAWLCSVGAGIAFGIASLAQPGLLLFVLATPIIYRGMSRNCFKVLLLRSFVVIASTVICLAPWHIRNCIIFNGQFCGIATNGGSVFYRANNPKATGLWVAEGEIPITHLPELEQNRIGFALGKQWILDNPLHFVKLATKKIMYLLGDDCHGAYLAILRGSGLSHDNSLRFNSPQRIWSYKLLAWISTIFWVMLVAWAAKGVEIKRLRCQKSDRAHLLPLIYPLLYSAAIFSVFESGSRQHMAAEGPLLILAASFLAGSETRLRDFR